MTRLEAAGDHSSLFRSRSNGAVPRYYFDNRATARQLRQKQADALRQATNPALPLSRTCLKTEREQLKLHIETLEAFAETVKNAGAVVEESSRRVHMTAAAERSLENEKR